MSVFQIIDKCRKFILELGNKAQSKIKLLYGATSLFFKLLSQKRKEIVHRNWIRIHYIIRKAKRNLKHFYQTIKGQICHGFILLIRKINILAHRHLALAFISYIISHELIFNTDSGFCEKRLYFATCALVFVAFLFGTKSVIYTCYICIGFLASIGYYGYINNQIFPNINEFSWSNITGFSWHNIFYEYFHVSITCLIILTLFPIARFISELFAEKPTELSKKDLYPDRIDTYNSISEYLSKHSVIGINSPYGNGKSTIVEVLKNEKKDWNFITFGVLSASVESIEFCIIREINRILETNGIFASPVNKIKSFFSHDFTYCIGELLFEEQTYENQIVDFVKGIQRLKKVIVLNFEDIDRIQDKTLINKIFSICDMLLKNDDKYTTKYIKIIYQCNVDTINKLFDTVDNEKRYAEKFIPHSIVLRVLAGQYFKSVLNKSPQKYSKIKTFEFHFLDRQMNQSVLGKTLSCEFISYTVRGIEQILDKTNFVFENNNSISAKNSVDVEAVLTFYIAQYFIHHVYESLEENTSMEDQKIFYPPNKENDEDKISLANIRAIIQTAQDPAKAKAEFFDKSMNTKSKENQESILFLTLLGYDDDYYDPHQSIPKLQANRRGDIINKVLFYHSYQ